MLQNIDIIPQCLFYTSCWNNDNPKEKEFVWSEYQRQNSADTSNDALKLEVDDSIKDGF